MILKTFKLIYSSQFSRGLSRALKPAVTLVSIVSFSILLTGCHQSLTGILNPKGTIAFQERQLLFDSLALMLIVVIPVIIMSFAFVFRYRASHRTAEYKPNWSHSVFLETIWWGIPCVIIVILGILTYRMTHRLDPYRAIDNHPVYQRIEVVALPWKWLFIYPKQHVATVNELEMPVGRQVEFLLTSDNVPMSAFFIPQLGSQIYTMAGMRTRLHLLPTIKGAYRGLDSQYNGDGFSDMHFPVKVVTLSEFKSWIAHIKRSPNTLNAKNYKQLRKPSIADPVKHYSSVETDLFKKIIKSYRGHRPVNK